MRAWRVGLIAGSLLLTPMTDAVADTQAPPLPDSEVTLLHADAVGTARARTVEGALEEITTPGPFGEPRETETLADPGTPGFAGKPRDAISGLDDFSARDYASTFGRFTSVDPAHFLTKGPRPQDYNLYSYGLNNPFMFVDPDGRASDTHVHLNEEIAALRAAPSIGANAQMARWYGLAPYQATTLMMEWYLDPGHMLAESLSEAGYSAPVALLAGLVTFGFDALIKGGPVAPEEEAAMLASGGSRGITVMERTAWDGSTDYVIPRTMQSTQAAFVWGEATSVPLNAGLPTNLIVPTFNKPWVLAWEEERLLALSYDELGFLERGLNADTSPIFQALDNEGIVMLRLDPHTFNRGPACSMWRYIPTELPPSAEGTKYYQPTLLTIGQQ